MFEEFIQHLFPRMVREKDLAITYTFCLGGMAFTAILFLAASGLLLLFYYQPTPEGAYRSILLLESSVTGGSYVRSVHRMFSHLLLSLVFLHVLRVVLTGAYGGIRERNWMTGAGLLLLALFGAYTGYLLPMDQLAFWATRTGVELLAVAPFGGAVRDLLVPDGVGMPVSLLRFYALHVAVVPGAMFALVFVHFFLIRKNRGVLPYL